jgi:glycosyltransferase involved in cell wall biosynthesis
MADKIRVLELVVSTDLGGGPIHVRDLISGLPPEEFEITVAGPGRGPLAETFGRLGAEFVDVPLDRLFPQNVSRVLRLIRKRRIQVVHSHGKGAGLFGRLAAWWAGVPAVHTFHGIHHADYSSVGRRTYVNMERLLASTSETIIHVSSSQAREAEVLKLAPADRTQIIVNATPYAIVRDLAEKQPLSREALDLPPYGAGGVLGTVARFDRVKALDVLIEAFALLPPPLSKARLLIIGDGPERGRLEALARDLKVAERVRFAGFIADAPRCMPAMDLYVSASRREGLPLSLLEAMACGLAVVATRVAGHVDAVEDGVTGLLVPVDNPGALASAMGALLGDSERRRRMGEAGRERVERDFSVSRMVAATAAVYRAAVRF